MPRGSVHRLKMSKRTLENKKIVALILQKKLHHSDEARIVAQDKHDCSSKKKSSATVALH